MDASWLDWMETVDIQTQLHDNDQSITILPNLVTDQAGLVGLIRRLHGMGIILISVQLLNSERFAVGNQNANER
jgi:hypothetical protein